MARSSYGSSTPPDVWVFEQETDNWTWVGGFSTPQSGPHSGIYGQQGFPGPDNTPGSGDDPALWIDAQGRLWSFGGYGLDKFSQAGMKNDLWRFKPGPITPRSQAAASWDLYQ